MNRPLANTGANDLRARLAEGLFDEGAYVRIYCPYHNDTTKPSGAVYEGHFYCFTCSRWAGRKEFLLLLSQTPSIHAISVVSRGAADSRPVSAALAEGYSKLLWTTRRERLSWLLARGLDERTIREAGLGHTGTKFTIPIYSGGGPIHSEVVQGEGSHRPLDAKPPLVSIKYRHDPFYDTCEDECHCPKYTNSSGSTATLFSPSPGGERVVLAEGEFDALILTRYGIPACSLTSGAGSGYEALSGLRESQCGVVVAYDMDHPGGLGALRVRDYLGGNCRIVTWHVERDEKGHVLPGWPKDVTDFVQMHGIEKFRRIARV